jgi:hypothetical protein
MKMAKNEKWEMRFFLDPAIALRLVWIANLKGKTPAQMIEDLLIPALNKEIEKLNSNQIQKMRDEVNAILNNTENSKSL